MSSVVSQLVVPGEKGLYEIRYRNGAVGWKSIVYGNDDQESATRRGITKTDAKAWHKKRRGSETVERPADDPLFGDAAVAAFAYYQEMIDRGPLNGRKPEIGQPALDNYVAMWRRLSEFLYEPDGKRPRPIVELRVSEFTRDVARQYMRWLAEPARKAPRGLAPSTQNGHLSALRVIWRYLTTNDVTDRDPFAKIPTVERPSQKPRPGWKAVRFDKDGLGLVVEAAMSKEFTDATPDVLLTNVVILIAYTGMRLSEAAGLRWGSISNDGFIEVREQRLRQKAAELAATKPELKHRDADAEPRVVWFNGSLDEAIRRQVDHELGKGLGGNDDFFCTDGPGRPVTVDQIKAAVARATRLAGFGKHGPQVLRRSYCTWMAQSGTPAAEAAAQTGHSIQVWEEDYVKPLLNGTRGQEIMRRMEAM